MSSAEPMTSSCMWPQWLEVMGLWLGGDIREWRVTIPTEDIVLLARVQRVTQWSDTRERVPAEGQSPRSSCTLAR